MRPEERKEYPPLREHIAVDIAIVGGGITGILDAYFLSKSGKKVALLESGALGSGVTLQTTAFITKVIDTRLSELVKTSGDELARIISESGQTAIDSIETIIKDEHIDCEFTRTPAYLYASTESQAGAIEEEYAEYQRLGLSAERLLPAALPFPNFGSLRIPNQAKFDPGKFISELVVRAEKNGARIFERSEVLSVKEGTGVTIETQSGEVKAKDVIIATYKPIVSDQTRFKKGMYRSYVCEVEAERFLEEALYFDLANPYHYFRVDHIGTMDRIIIGGEDHRDELQGLDKRSYDALEKYINILFGKKKHVLVGCWYGGILESSDGIPLIGEIKPHVYVATAFSGNGMTYAMISAMLLTNLISEGGHPWQEAYDPKRSLLSKRTFAKGIDYIEEFFGGAIKNLLS